MSYVPTGLDEDILQHIGKAASSVPLQDFNIHQGEFLHPVLTPGAALASVKLPCWKLRSEKEQTIRNIVELLHYFLLSLDNIKSIKQSSCEPIFSLLQLFSFICLTLQQLSRLQKLLRLFSQQLSVHCLLCCGP